MDVQYNILVVDDETDLTEIFRFANVCGALNTLGRGAIDHLPDRKAVLKKLAEA